MRPSIAVLSAGAVTLTHMVSSADAARAPQVSSADDAVVGESHGEAQQPAPPPDPWTARPLSIELHLGVATPTGGVGLMADYSFAPWLSLGCGVGTNIVGPAGACMARARAVAARDDGAFYFGVGVSGGRHLQSETIRLGAASIFLGALQSMAHRTPRSDLTWEFAKWINFEIGREVRTDGGAVYRMYLGGAALLNPSAGVPGTNWQRDGVVEANVFMLYAGFALGRAF